MGLLETTISNINGQNQEARGRARERLEQLTMPHWALGRLMDLAEDLAGICGSITPGVSDKVIVTMAGDHGVVSEGVSRYPQEVTPQMVHNFVNRGAGINALAETVGAHVVVVDMGVAADLGELVRAGRIIDHKIAPGTANIAQGPAMNREQARSTLEAGIQVAQDLAPGTDIFGTGDMGIGNTTPSSAILAIMTGCDVKTACGPGTGIAPEQVIHKAEIVQQAISCNQPDANDPVDVLAKVGGFEIGGIAGLILGAASLRKPIIIDGFISTAGALIARALAPASAEFMIAAHCSAEPGHRIMLEQLGKTALLDLGLRLGEGTGAALAMHLTDAAAAILTQVATFEEAAVSES